VIVVVAAGIAMLVTPCGRKSPLISMLVTEGSITTAPEQSGENVVRTFAAETVYVPALPQGKLVLAIAGTAPITEETGTTKPIIAVTVSFAMRVREITFIEGSK
jgi:hypothetical protein